MRKANDASSKPDVRVAAASNMPLAEQETIPPDGSVDTASGVTTAETLPREFGRYRIERRLGQGTILITDTDSDFNRYH